MPELHGGTVTFLFTDIEGSTRLLKALGEGYGDVLGEHQRILRAAFAAHGGQEVDTQGDSFFFAFPRAKGALAAALEAQRALAAHGWPEGVEVRVRMGLHSGEPVVGEERYVGIGVHRAARVGAAAHGGQVLLSSATRELVEDDLPEGVSLRDLGLVRLKDIDRPERISQLAAEGLRAEFPPLRGAERVAPPRLLRRRSLLVAMLAGVVAAAVAIPVFALGGGGSGGPAALAGVEANAVGAIDLASGRVVASIPVGTTPSSVAFGEGAIWVTNADGDTVSRIDPRTKAAVETIPVGNGPAGIAVCGGFVWVANNLDGTVSKVDPRTNGVVDTKQVGAGPIGVACDERDLWIANSNNRTVTRLDPRSGTLEGTIPAGAGADGIAAGAGAVWVTSESAGSVARIDPRAGSVIETINVGSGASAVAVGAGAVWVTNSQDGTVSRIDPASNRAAATIAVGDGPSGVAVTGGTAVWVSNELAGTLSRIDPARNEVVQTLRTGNRPEGVALATDTIYVAVRASGLTHRGGTLSVLSEINGFDSIDPASAFSPSSWSALILTNDGLTAFRRVGGSDGARLVPDLATSLPTPSDGGRTYTFQLRRGIRYSTGAPVRPEDFRRAFERAFAHADAPSIVGVDECVKKPKPCDLSKGIVADPVSNTVTFHLSAPDPDLLYKLALPNAFAVPVDTPVKARLPLPATGPYMIASYDPKHGLRLVRNPRFHEWSPAAQPSGNPNEITWRFGVSPEAQARAIERGKADLTFALSDLSAARLSVLRTQYASQLHFASGHRTDYLFLNTRLPPFDDLRVRRAFNLAVDRNRMVELYGGPDFAQLSCQVLPPNFDGHRRYCPYTIDPSPDGKYTGPDLAKAIEFVDSSGTKGQAVTISILEGFAPKGAYFASVLESLGYRARLKIFKDFNAYSAAVDDSRRKTQAGGNAWISDYASPSNFFLPLFTCSSFQPGTPNNLNVAEFCNPHIDAEIAHAHSLQASDPQAASRLWSQIDRDVVDQAPWLVLANPKTTAFVSRRVGNYQYSPQWGTLLGQLWIR